MKSFDETIVKWGIGILSVPLKLSIKKKSYVSPQNASGTYSARKRTIASDANQGSPKKRESVFRRIDIVLSKDGFCSKSWLNKIDPGAAT